MKKNKHISKVRFLFQVFAEKISNLVGTPLALILALLICLGWAIVGVFFDFSEPWQLFISTVSSIVTFLMVFLIQNTQNRETKAIQLKLDELLKKAGVKNPILDIEDLSEEERDEFKEAYTKLSQKYQNKKKKKR